MIQGAAAGSADDREQFALRYAAVVRAYLAARWRDSPLLADLDDAAQEVFLDCFRHRGALERVDPARPGGFRPFLYGVVRNVALRVETGRARGRERQSPGALDLDEIAASEAALSQVFDRAWATAVLREAAERHTVQAREQGKPALRRVELLRLRFHEGLPIRDIARQWEVDAAVLHHEYAKARQEFKAALLDVLAFHHPGSPAEVEQACADLVALLA